MVFGPVSDSPDERVHDCTTRQQNAHIIEQREVLYRWHPWHGRKVSIVAAMTRGGVAIFRCHADDGRRALEIPQWMFDAATCCRMQLAAQAIVACRALSDVRDLVEVIDRVPSIPLLDAEHLVSDTEGDAQATQDSNEIGPAAAAVRADRAATLDRHPDRGARAHDHAARATAAPAHPRASRTGGAR